MVLNSGRVLEKADELKTESEVRATRTATFDRSRAKFSLNSIDDETFNAKGQSQLFADISAGYSKLGEDKEKNLNESAEIAGESQYYDAVSEVDLVPTSTTMQFKFEDDDYLDEDMRNGERANYKISARGKLMIVVYALVIMTLIALITINSKVLKAMEDSIKSGEESVVRLEQELANKSVLLERASDEQVIIDKAIEFGMKK